MAREKGMGNLQKEKSGRYTARICIDGERISRSTRTKNYNKAETYLQRMLKPFGRGEQKIPLADAWREYERSSSRRETSVSTLQSKKVIWFKFAQWIEENHCEIIHLNQLSKDVIAEYLRVIRPGRAAGTYNNNICILREICHVLLEASHTIEDPWRSIKLLPEDVHPRRELTRNELALLIKEAEKISPEWKKLFIIAIYTGLRLGDCCMLEWQQINIERNIIQLIPRKTRRHAHGMPVTIPIHQDLLASINETTKQDDKYVLPQIAKWYSSSEHWRIGYLLEEIFNNAKIKTSVKLDGRKIATPDATFHSLRHTFVSFSANAGVPLAVVQSIVGHSSTIMTRHYYHENEESLSRAISAIPALSELTTSNHKISPSSSIQRSPSIQQLPSKSIASRLEELNSLRDQKLITIQEYKKARKKILLTICN